MEACVENTTTCLHETCLVHETQDLLIETRQQLLQSEQGVSDYDPGKCFDGRGFSFKNCCNGLNWSKYVPPEFRRPGQPITAQPGEQVKPSFQCFDGKGYTYERCCPAMWSG